MTNPNPNISDLWDRYKDYSAAVSDSVRQLSLAGIAVVWVFTDGKQRSIAAMPAPFAWAMVFFILALLADFSQYLYGTIAFRIIARRREIRNITQHVGVAPAVFVPLETAFAVKAFCVFLGYIALGAVFFSRA